MIKKINLRFLKSFSNLANIMKKMYTIWTPTIKIKHICRFFPGSDFSLTYFLSTISADMFTICCCVISFATLVVGFSLTMALCKDNEN